MRVKKKRVLLLKVFIGAVILSMCIQIRILQTRNELKILSFFCNKMLITKTVVEKTDDKTIQLQHVQLNQSHSQVNIKTRDKEDAKKTMKLMTEPLKYNREHGKATSKHKETHSAQGTKFVSNKTIDKLKADDKIYVKQSNHRPRLGNNLDASKSTMSSKFLSTWRIWSSMVKQRNVTPIGDQSNKLKTIVNTMKNAKIVFADVGHGGTALKVSLILEGEQEVVFRPKRYDMNKVITGTPIQGHDRHNGEIAAFHIDRILGFYRAPPVVGRKINILEEIKPFGESDLIETFFRKGNNTCFYGVCYLCRKETAACADGNIIEGSLTLWLPYDLQLKRWRCPWQRITRTGLKSLLEIENYCPAIGGLPRTALLDIIDTSIFDFLIGNADRHHYEWFLDGVEDTNDGIGMILHIDNAKSFGNPYRDQLQVLVPLFQCCVIRRSTWERLIKIHENTEKTFGDVLRVSLKSDPLYPVLADGHFVALNRRLQTVVNMTETCIEKYDQQHVILEDGN